MVSLADRTASNFYGDLLQVSNSNSGIDTTARAFEDGKGTQSAAKLSSYGINVPVDTSDTDNPPTEAQVISAFGAAADVGTGFVALMDDGGAGTAVSLVASDGTNWWQVALTVTS